MQKVFFGEVIFLWKGSKLHRRRCKKGDGFVLRSIYKTRSYPVVQTSLVLQNLSCINKLKMLIFMIRLIGEGIIRMKRSDIFSKDSGLCIDHIHRLSCRWCKFQTIWWIVDLPPLQQLPSTLLMQNFPSLVTSKVLSPQPGETVLDCCAAPGNKWSHLAMLMKDQGIVVHIHINIWKSNTNH